MSAHPVCPRRSSAWLWIALASSILSAVMLAPGVYRLPVETPGGVAWPAAALGNRSPSALVSASDVGPAATSSSPVEISRGQDGSTLIAGWTLPPGVVVGEGLTMTPADGAAVSGQPATVVAVAPGRHAIALPPVAGAGPWQVTVDVITTTGAVRLGPSTPFDAASDTVTGTSRARVQAASRPCQGTSYPIGAVTVDGYAGYQGSYCSPPTFSGGTGAFCVDHGLDYPAGMAADGWQPIPIDAQHPLTNQYGHPADPSDVARLNWILGQWGATVDADRAVAIGLIAHAIMGDYPGLTVPALDPVEIRVTGGHPAVIAQDVGALWHASGQTAGPYTVTVTGGPGPLVVGQPARGQVRVSGRGGGPVVGVPLDFGGSSGVSVMTDQPALTGPAGTLGFQYTPTAATFTIAAHVNTGLPGLGVTLWNPSTAPGAVQRVVTAGPPLRPSGNVTLAATPTGQASLVKQSDDPAWLPVTTGFGFDVQRPTGTAGAWVPVAHRDTSADGTMAPITGLAAGDYQVVETAHPPAFGGGGPWTFSLAPGQHATWTMIDHAAATPVRIVKAGDNANVPIGAGVTFGLAFDRAGDGSYATPVATLTTGADAATPLWSATPGRYRLTEIAPPAGYLAGPPVEFTVAPAATSNPPAMTVTVSDRAIPGRIALTKQDADTGARLAGAVIALSRPDGQNQMVGKWTTTAAGPVVVDGLPAGAYLLREVRAPPGYHLPAEAHQTVRLAPGQTLAVTFGDRAIPAPTTAPTGSASSPAVTSGAPTSPLPVAPATSAPAPAAPPVVPPAQLAFTGLPVWRLAVGGVALAVVGLALVGLARRRVLSGRPSA